MASLEACKQYAERIAIFRSLTAEEVRDILKMGQVNEFQQGKTIFHEGTLGNNLFIVLKGEISIYRRATEIAVLKRGEAFGEMAVLNDEPRSATASAKTDCRLFSLSDEQVHKIIKTPNGVKILLNVIHVLSARLADANIQLAQRG